MKRYIISAMLCMGLAMGFTASAQEATSTTSSESQEVIDQLIKENKKYKAKEEDRRIWGKGRFTRIGYSIAQTQSGMDPVEKSKFGVSLSKGTTFRFPTIAGMVKLGIDAVWFDVTYAKYKSPYDGAWTSEIVTNGDVVDDVADALNIGRMSVTIGAFGVGPNVSVAPFAFMHNGLSPLRVSLYFHWQPTAQLYIKSEDGDVELAPAFCGMWDFGGVLHYRGIGVGVEGRWGQGKIKPIAVEGVDLSGDDKISRKFANTRIFVNFAF